MSGGIALPESCGCKVSGSVLVSQCAMHDKMGRDQETLKQLAKCNEELIVLLEQKMITMTRIRENQEVIESLQIDQILSLQKQLRLAK